MTDAARSPKDLFIDAQIERAMKPYLAITPPALLATMRANLERILRTHHVAARLVDHAIERPAPIISGEVANEEVEPAEKRGQGGR